MKLPIALLAALALAGCAGSNGAETTAASAAIPADQPTDTLVDNFVNNDGVAIRGYDPVAYHTQNAAVAGSDEFTTMYDGATWRFSSAENRDLFVSNPIAYAPAYGGFCAFGLSAAGRKIDTNPELFHVVDGTLYLNSTERADQNFASDTSGHIVKGGRNWMRIRLE